MRQTLGIEIVPRRRPLVGERLQAQFPASRDRRFVATAQLDAVHTELLDLRHGRRRRRVPLLGGPFRLQETLPEPVLRSTRHARTSTNQSARGVIKGGDGLGDTDGRCALWSFWGGEQQTPYFQ